MLSPHFDETRSCQNSGYRYGRIAGNALFFSYRLRTYITAFPVRAYGRMVIAVASGGVAPCID
jgi:hypothetical protein